MNMIARPLLDADGINMWFKGHLADLIDVPTTAVDDGLDFESFGIDSIQAVEMVTALEGLLGLPDDIQLDFIFDAPSIKAAADEVAALVTAVRAR